MDHRITHVITQLSERLHDTVSIERLAAGVGLSMSRLRYLFRQATGVTPGAYLHALRMERARLLIESTPLTVRDVMRQVGLSDPSHFARDFRNAHGLSPRTYRLQLRMAGPPARFVNAARLPAGTAVDLRTNPPTGPGAALWRAVNTANVLTKEKKKQCAP
jgi:AraC-like DNA-binding protein